MADLDVLVLESPLDGLAGLSVDGSRPHVDLHHRTQLRRTEDRSYITTHRHTLFSAWKAREHVDRGRAGGGVRG